MAANIDLHMHSIFSDGSDSAEELVSHIQEKSISVFSLTDHDTLEGCLRIAELVPEGIDLYMECDFHVRVQMESAIF